MPPLAQGRWTLSVCCAPHPPARLQDAEKLGYLCVGSVAGLTSAPGGGARRGSLGQVQPQLQLENVSTWREACQRDPQPPGLCTQPRHRVTRVRAMAGPQIPQEASSILGACHAPSPTQQAAPADAAVPADKQAPGLRRWQSRPHHLRL